MIGDPLTVFGDGLQRRAFSYIDDSLEPLWLAGTSPEASKQIINLGGVHDNTILDAANAVIAGAKAVGIEPTSIIHLPPRHEVKIAFPTYQKSIDVLKFEHTTSLEDGVLKMWKWAKEQPAKHRKVWQEYEITKDLYDYWKPEALKDGYWRGK